TVHLRVGIGREDLAVAGPDDVEAVLDVALDLLLRKRLQVKAQPHALHELCELGRVELVVELGLPGENDPQHLVLGGLDTREQADLLQHAHGDRKSTRLNSSHSQISYAVFCLKKKSSRARTQESPLRPR